MHKAAWTHRCNMLYICILYEQHRVIITGFISVRLNETLYSVNSIGDNGVANNDLKRLDQNSGAENSCLPVGVLKHTKQPGIIEAPGSQFSERETKRQTVSSSLSGQSFYVDVDVPAELRTKVDFDFFETLIVCNLCN